jgi:hypothetical protein
VRGVGLVVLWHPVRERDKERKKGGKLRERERERDEGEESLKT